jgi:hypothetical protein
LIIVVNRAEGIKDVEYMGKQDPYCVVKIMPGDVRT